MANDDKPLFLAFAISRPLSFWCYMVLYCGPWANLCVYQLNIASVHGYFTSNRVVCVMPHNSQAHIAHTHTHTKRESEADCVRIRGENRNSFCLFSLCGVLFSVQRYR